MRRVLIIYSLFACACALGALPPPSASISLPPPAVSRDWDTPPIYPIQKVGGDPVVEFSAQRKKDASIDGNVSFGHAPVYTPNMLVYTLPSPALIPGHARMLSLHDAIALALRGNPTIEVSELQRILDKFGM